jgi:hypothetical protein
MIRCQLILFLQLSAHQSRKKLSHIMAEQQLTIIFGCFATVLAIVGIILTYVQFGTYAHQSLYDTTSSGLENGRSSVVAASGDLEEIPGRWYRLNVLPFMVNMNPTRNL